jgi:ABC-type transport system involved in multi-copper enzyme maturation permease subunit
LLSGTIDLLFGPLAGLECHRALSRRWVLVVRLILAAAAVVVVLLTLFAWAVAARFSDDFRPGGLFSGALSMIEATAVILSVVITPAMVAGSLAGERVRGTLMLLLISHVTPREIVSARCAGRLSVVGVLLLGGLPPVAALAGANSIGWLPLLVLLVYPAVIAFGAAGLSLAASVVTSRGRDALLGVYLLVVGFLLLPLLRIYDATAPLAEWTAPLNPFHGLFTVIWAGGQIDQAAMTMLYWASLGLFGITFAAWRLQPLRMSRARSRSGRPKKRWRRIPEMRDRPVLWKELYVEQHGGLNWTVRGLGWLLVIGLIGGTGFFATQLIYYKWWVGDIGQATSASLSLEFWVDYTAVPVSWLIQWTVGLRAAVTIASERERGTWDALIASPLDGREIVGAKIWGNVYALRGLLIAVAITWIVPAALGAVEPELCATLIADALAVGTFMAVVGVWASLTSATDSSAMTKTLVAWLIASVVTTIGSLIMAGVLAGLYASAWQTWHAYYERSVGYGSQPSLMSFWTAWNMAQVALYALMALVGIVYLKRRFDTLAGRRATTPIASPFVRSALPPVVVQGAPPATGVANYRPRHEETDKARDFWGGE